jgi:hypothetical protein
VGSTSDGVDDEIGVISGVKSEPSERLECAGEASNAATRGFNTLTALKKKERMHILDSLVVKWARLTIVDKVRGLIEGATVAEKDERHG